MSRTTLSQVFFCTLLITLSYQSAVGEIDFKTGKRPLVRQDAEGVRNTLQALAERPDARRIVVQFDGPLSPAQRRQLADAGVALLNYVGDHAYFASVLPNRFNANAAFAAGPWAAVSAIDRAWKLHGDLARGEVHPWSVVTRTKEKGEPEDQGRLVVALYVLLHPDVRLDPDGVRVCLEHGASIRSRLESINGLVIELPFSEIESLADEDVVQWIEPPLPKFSELNNDNRLRTGADIVQAPPYGLDGSGVTVLVYDGGTGLASHVDFGGRLTVRDSSGLSDHSTHVAGTVGGSGAASGGTYRGMAPGVLIESYGYEQVGGLHEGFLYSDPGDLEADYDEAINVHGADISNNSIGTNTAPNGFPCEWEGNYGVTGNLIDAIAAGSLGAPFRIVWANGNERQTSRCGSSYLSTAPPACAKNHITVGAMNSNDDSVTSFTSWGPCDDGRIKPDISGPGCQSNDDFEVTSCSSSGGYTGKCGTSMASPTICGLSALLLQDFRAHYPGEPDFRNSMLKAFLAQTAEDIENPGPDFKTGYGSVRIQPAIDLMRAGNFLSNEVDQGSTSSALVVVNPGDGALKVTLAWDDVPGTPNVNPVLVNDLDLEVFDQGNTQYFPWTLDPGNPSVDAVRTQADHVNNIEQVVIDAPTPGVYRVDVVGFNVPQGPQTFSLTASPLLVACSSTGVVTLDRVKYACSSSATIRVVDCDLNTDDGMVETVTVTIASSSEPGGESVLLTETGAETAAFEGTIPLNTSSGVGGELTIADGDTVTATYVDADDGQGGINVIMNDMATVDCSPPIISNVQTLDIEPHSASVSFETDEDALAEVHYGLACGALTNSASGGLDTLHSISLSGLDDDTTYFYSIEVEDQAGNPAADDNGGNCYSFATPQVPDYFTEQFTGDFDLDGFTIEHVPNASVDQYAMCGYPAGVLPTDPAGGTVLSLSDDGSATATLGAGAQVLLYGNSYSSFFINANGNLTFNSSDGTYTESLDVHFNQPRVSALFDDLNPSVGGTVSWKQTADRVAVTWENVPEYSTSDSNTFQIELFFDGRIDLTWLQVDSGDNIIGLSEGLGLSPDYFESDLSAAGSCGPPPPTAFAQSVNTARFAATDITLTGDDPNGDPLEFIITSLPATGQLIDPNAGVIGAVPYTLVGNGDVVHFAPMPLGFLGKVAFDFHVSNGSSDSSDALVTVTVGDREPVFEFLMDDADPGWETEGQWTFGPPSGGGSHDGDPTSGFTGANVFGYNLNGDYTNNMTATWLTSLGVPTPNLVGTELRFRRWLGVDSSSFDQASIELASIPGVWAPVWEHTGAAISESAWSLQTVDISAQGDMKAKIYVRWGMGPTDGATTYPGWNIDDVQIWGIDVTAPLCAGVVFQPADANADGSVNGLDVKTFVDILIDPLAGWTGPQICASELTGDEQVDDADIGPFVDSLLGP